MENKNNIHMKRSPSELAFEMFIASEEDHKASIFGRFNGHSDDHMLSSYNKNLGHVEGVAEPIELEEDSLWSSKNIYSDQPKAPLPVNSLSSVYVDSPISVNNSSKIRDSSNELLSDEDDQDDIEAGPCEQSKNPTDVKRMRRMKSNRDSARRSRQRKQAHLSDLQQQVEQLQGESTSLFKQLALATQQFKDATTNNRVLRSDVEALRAKVKLAEDLVARGSLTSSLNHLLQNYLNTAHDCIDSTNLDVLDHNTFPAIIPSSGGQVISQYNGTTDHNLGPDSAKPEPEPELFDSIISSGVIDPEIWSWESLIDSPMSKVNSNK